MSKQKFYSEDGEKVSYSYYLWIIFRLKIRKFIQRLRDFKSRRPHRSFRLTRHRDAVRPLKLPGYWAFTKSVWQIIKQHKGFFLSLLAIIVIFGIATFGLLGQDFINLLSDTLEDTDRGLTSEMPISKIKDIKIYGKTAIPTGTYKIVMNVISETFKNRSWAKPYGGKLPRLVNVPGYEGVLIHVGNTADDTSGCLLVGRNKVVGKVTESTATFVELMNILKDDSNIEITIE